MMAGKEWVSVMNAWIESEVPASFCIQTLEREAKVATVEHH